MTDENIRIVKRIADELEAINEGRAYICKHCGEMYATESDKYGPCPDCKTEEPEAEEEEEENEQATMYDYLDEVYNIEYRVDGPNAEDINSVSIMVACGGPNVYIDTGDRKVKLYWWTERAEYDLSSSVCDEINEMYTETWNCQKE